LEVKWKFFAQGVLIAFKRIDLGDAEVEGISKTNHLRRSLGKELELCVAEASRSHRKLRVKRSSIYQA
jgi:hypothetical protein